LPKLFSFPFSTLSFAETILEISDLSKKKLGAYVCIANVHMTVEASNNTSFGEVLRESDLAVLDGMPLCWSYKLLHGFMPDRIAGRHLMHALIQDAVLNGRSIFFFGSTPEKLVIAEQFLVKNYPGLHIAGMISPPFRPLTVHENKVYASQINDSGASLVFVALGCPKQEIWMHHMKSEINATMLGIGIALEVLTGQQLSSPSWMERAGLEWFFRLLKEPRRLFKRYLYTNTYFIFILVRAILQKNKIILTDLY
jgi:N-acetylglucosaminyldiphosphoundecaprenol N-acetyl-beta-D-mannosaminyltransferase